MDCKEFQEQISNFIFDKIQYSSDIEDFLEHYKQCDNCKEELRLYYMVRRGLGDVESPMDEEMPDVIEELECLISHYDRLFRTQKTRRRVLYVGLVAVAIVLIAAIVFYMLMM